MHNGCLAEEVPPTKPNAVYLIASTSNPPGHCLQRLSKTSSKTYGVAAPFCLSLPPGDVQEFKYDAYSRLVSRVGNMDMCLTTNHTRRNPGDLPYLKACLSDTTDMLGQRWISDTSGRLHAFHFQRALCLSSIGTRLVVASCGPSIATTWIASKLWHRGALSPVQQGLLQISAQLSCPSPLP